MRGSLTLSRRIGESIIIGEGDDAAVVTVVKRCDGRLVLQVKAPNHVRIDRSEVRGRIVMADVGEYDIGGEG